MPEPTLTASLCFQDLQSHHAAISTLELRDLFARDPQRFAHFSLKAAGLLLDYSKNRLDQTTLALLTALAREQQLEARRNAMFAGKKINLTERRAALHTALRAPRAVPLVIDGQDLGAQVHAVLDHMQAFSERVRSGSWLGRDGRAITDIVNIGIGGSFLGPNMVCHALRSLAHPRLAGHFVSNVDGHDLAAVLAKIDPATTLSCSKN